MDYEQKYLKYKTKYLQLKKKIEGGANNQIQSNKEPFDVTLIGNDIEQFNDAEHFIHDIQTGGGTHRENFLKKHNLEDRGYSLKELSRISKVPLSILQEVYDRGSGAYKTNRTSVRLKGSFKKNVDAPYKMKLSKAQWSFARTYSYLDGNPKHDTDLRKKIKNKK